MNNFNTNDKGISVDLYVNCDSYISRMEWDENFETVVEPQNRTYGLYQYTGYDNDIEIMGMNDLKGIHPKTLKRDLLEYALSVDWNYYSKTEVRAMNKEELINLIESDDDFEYMDLHEWEELMSNSNIGINLDDYTIYKTRGYSQGDYAQVVIHDSQQFEGLEKYIDNLFWDQPILARGEVNGEEFYIDEHMEDRYEWDIDEAKEIVRTKFDFDQDVIDEIIKLLPDNPSYD